MSEPAQIIRFATPNDVLATSETRLVDVVDRLLDAGIVIRAELWLTVADIELVFLGADILLANPEAITRHRTKRAGLAPARAEGARSPA